MAAEMNTYPDAFDPTYQRSDDELVTDGIHRCLVAAEQFSRAVDRDVRIRALQQQTNALVLSGRILEAEQKVATLLDLALAEGDAGARADAWITRGRIDSLRGAYPNACRSLRLAIDIADTDVDGRDRYAENAFRNQRAWGLLATTSFLKGDKRISMNAMRSAYSLAMASGDSHVLASLHASLAEFHQLRDEPDQARDAAMEGIAIARKHGFDALLNESSLHFWIASGTVTPSEEAIANIQSLLDLRSLLGIRLRKAYFTYGLAHSQLAANRLDQARDSIDEAIDIAMLYGERGHLALLLNERARIRMDADRSTRGAGTADAKKAFYIAASQKARHLQHAALSLLPDARDASDEDSLSPGMRPAPSPC